MKHLHLLLVLLLSLSLITGCNDDKKSSDTGTPAADQPTKKPTGKKPSNGGSNSGVSTGSTTNNFAIPTATNLVKEVSFEADINELITEEDQAKLDEEYSDCGVSNSLVPACKGTAISVSTNTISTYGGSPSTNIEGRVGRFTDSKKTVFLFKFTEDKFGQPKKSEFNVFVVENASTEELDKLVRASSDKLRDLPTSERLVKLEETLGIKKIATITEWSFADEAEFVTAYEEQSNPRAIFHWTQIALSKGFKGNGTAAFLKDNYEKSLTKSSPEYKELLIELGLNAAEVFKAKDEVITALESEFTSASEKSIKGITSIAILKLVDIAEAKKENLDTTKEYLLDKPESNWLIRGVALFSKYGKTIGSIDDLIKFGMNDNSYVRAEVARALNKYSDEPEFAEWVLRLNADTVYRVREAALATITGQNLEVEIFDVVSLINSNDSYSREGLAKALAYTKGQKASEALLQLSGDTVYRVREAALASISGRDIDLGGFNVASLINSNDSYAREGLAKALAHTKGQKANIALLQLAGDTVYRVREAALSAISGKSIDVGDFNVANLINPNDSYAREGLAKALKYTNGQKTNEALLQLSGDTVYRVREAALASISGKSIDVGSFNVAGLINLNDSYAREGLAKALKDTKGQKSNEALLQLAGDTVYRVREAALASVSGRVIKIGDFDVSTLVNANDSYAREGLAKALEFTKGSKVVKTLVKLLSDSVYRVREAAKKSLGAHDF
jgi:HEAT repeat protein